MSTNTSKGALTSETIGVSPGNTVGPPRRAGVVSGISDGRFTSPGTSRRRRRLVMNIPLVSLYLDDEMEFKGGGSTLWELAGRLL